MHSSLLEFLRSLALDQSLTNGLMDISESLIYEKNQVVLARGRIAHKLLFVEQGHLLSSKMDEAHLITNRFWKPGQLVLPQTGPFANIPEEFSLTALDHVEVKAIGLTPLSELLKHAQNGQRLLLKLMEIENEHLIDRVHILQKMRPIARYKKFMEEYPSIGQLVKGEIIASYLNVSTATFTRVKRAF